MCFGVGGCAGCAVRGAGWLAGPGAVFDGVVKLHCGRWEMTGTGPGLECELCVGLV